MESVPIGLGDDDGDALCKVYTLKARMCNFGVGE